MSASALMDSGASHNFIAAPQVIKFSNNIQESLISSFKPMEVHLADYSSLISHQIVCLLLKFADGAMHNVEFRVFPTLNYTIILGMLFLHLVNTRIN